MKSNELAPVELLIELLFCRLLDIENKLFVQLRQGSLKLDNDHSASGPTIYNVHPKISFRG